MVRVSHSYCRIEIFTRLIHYTRRMFIHSVYSTIFSFCLSHTHSSTRSLFNYLCCWASGHFLAQSFHYYFHYFGGCKCTTTLYRPLRPSTKKIFLWWLSECTSIRKYKKSETCSIRHGYSFILKNRKTRIIFLRLYSYCSLFESEQRNLWQRRRTMPTKMVNDSVSSKWKSKWQTRNNQVISFQKYFNYAVIFHLNYGNISLH